MLHVVNGEAVLGPLQRSSIPGEFLPWPEILSEGPLWEGPGTAADWERRAAWLDARRLAPRDRYLASVQALPDRLRKAGGHDEVVLWFEDACWFCQANLLGLLAGPFAGHVDPPKVRLVLHDGPLGAQLAPSEAEALLAAREPLTLGRADLAGKAWAAVAAPDPTRLAALAREGDFAAWPRLREGLAAHLARLPGPHGLSALEAALLRALVPGPRGFVEAFQGLRADPLVRTLGVSDVQALAALRGLVEARPPLAARAEPLAGGDLRHARLAATTAGRDVLQGTQDRVRLAGIDAWVGGVRLEGRGPTWRWDGRTLGRA